MIKKQHEMEKLVQVHVQKKEENKMTKRQILMNTYKKVSQKRERECVAHTKMSHENRNHDKVVFLTCMIYRKLENFIILFIFLSR